LEASRSGLITQQGEHPSLVVCSIPDEPDLLLEAQNLSRQQIRFILFREPDLNNQVTALATEPLPLSQRKKLRHLKLLSL
jgi:hypothetical protein